MEEGGTVMGGTGRGTEGLGGGKRSGGELQEGRGTSMLELHRTGAVLYPGRVSGLFISSLC